MGIGVETPFPPLDEVVLGGKVLGGVEEIGTMTDLDVVEVTSVEDTPPTDDDREEEIELELGAGASSFRASTQ